MTTTDTAVLVRQMRNTLYVLSSMYCTGLCDEAIAAADQWLAQQPSPPKTGNITDPCSVEEIRANIVPPGYSAERMAQHAMLYLERQRGPLTDADIAKLMPPCDGTAEANKQWTTMAGGFPCVEFDEVDAWSRDLVIATVMSALRAHGIGQPAGEDKQ